MRDVPFVIEVAIGDVKLAQEAPDVCVRPVDDSVNAHEARPARVSRAPEAELGCERVISAFKAMQTGTDVPP